MLKPYTSKGAVVSKDGLYRHQLSRFWNDGAKYALWVMLNPSTADAREDDATIRRVNGFCQEWYSSEIADLDGFIVVNLWDFRATDWTELRSCERPSSSANDIYIKKAAQRASLIIAAWGGHAPAVPGGQVRADQVVEMLLQYGDIHCLRENSDGTPAHPLMLPSDLVPRVWRRKAT